MPVLPNMVPKVGAAPVSVQTTPANINSNSTSTYQSSVSAPLLLPSESSIQSSFLSPLVQNLCSSPSMVDVDESIRASFVEGTDALDPESLA